MLILAIAVLLALFIISIGGIITLAAAGLFFGAMVLGGLAFVLAIFLVASVVHLVWRILDPERAKAAWEGRSTQGAYRLPGETREQAEARLAARQESWRAMRGA